MSRRCWNKLFAAAVLVAGLWIAAPSHGGTFNSGSTGADGPFNPTCTPTPCTVTVPLPPSGVFHHTTGNVPAGVTAKFARNATNTPVTLLFIGDVTIAGTINLDGGPGSPGTSGTSFANAGGKGEPGGFDGGAGGNAVAAPTGGAGLGPGGGPAGILNSCPGAGGGFGTPGANFTGGSCAARGGATYGNPQLLPLIGGSGGGGTTYTLGVTGGAGGGALLIASSGSLTLTGAITAQGGAGG